MLMVCIASAGVIGVLVGMPAGEARQRRRLTAALNELRDRRERQPFDPPSELAIAELQRALHATAEPEPPTRRFRR